MTLMPQTMIVALLAIIIIGMAFLLGELKEIRAAIKLLTDEVERVRKK
jgi:hypothetical protein